MQLVFKKRFQKSLKKLLQNKPNLKKRVAACLYDFEVNGFSADSYRKPLKGLGLNIHELEVGGDIRILVEVLIIEDKAYLLNIGTHSSLELSSSKKTKR